MQRTSRIPSDLCIIEDFALKSKKVRFDSQLEIEDRKQNFVTDRLVGVFKKTYPLLPLDDILTLVVQSL